MNDSDFAFWTSVVLLIAAAVLGWWVSALSKEIAELKAAFIATTAASAPTELASDHWEKTGEVGIPQATKIPAEKGKWNRIK